jgi:hypothetical protein
MSSKAPGYKIISQFGTYQLINPRGELVGTYWTILAAYDASHEDRIYEERKARIARGLD